MEDKTNTVPIRLKMTLTARDAAEYSNISINKIDSILRVPPLPLRVVRRDETAGKAPGV